MALLTITNRTAGKNNKITILDLSGKITIGEGSVQLREAVRELLDSGVRKIILNMGDVSYVDNSGIGELVSSYTSTNQSEGRLILENLTKKIQDLLVICKLITVFEVFETEKAAIASFK
jgi:anti-sigma B factor antagonist